MWEVIERNGRKESIKKFVGYGEAYSYYEKEAARVNAVDEEGDYLLPNVRVSLRKTPVE